MRIAFFVLLNGRLLFKLIIYDLFYILFKKIATYLYIKGINNKKMFQSFDLKGAKLMVKKVLFFGDVGIDDAIALVYARLTEDIDIIGIVADYGNVSKKETTRNVRFLLKRSGKEYIKVYG